MSNRRRERRFEIKLRYIDKNHGIDLITGVNSPPSLTINDIIRDVIEFLFLDDMPPKDIQFVGYEWKNHYYPINDEDHDATLEELEVTDGCILHFKPTPNAAPPKQCELKIIGPNETDKILYPWFRAKTTLNMLFDFVIEQFSLQYVEHERIHLLSIFEELECFAFPDSRLSECNLHDGMTVHVQITPTVSSTSVKNNKIIHVRCTCGETQFNIDVLDTETIEDIKRKIKERFGDYLIIDFELYNDSNEELISEDRNRTLQSFGVQPDETIYARFRLDTRKVQSPMKSSNRNLKYTKVTIICNTPSKTPETFPVSLTTTVEQVLRRVEEYTQNHQELIVTKMYSNKIQIDFEHDASKSLADLGFQEDDIIDIVLKDRAFIHSTMLNQQTTMATINDLRSNLQQMEEEISNIKNQVDTLYMNSVFQCLAYVPQLTSFFLNDFHHTNNDDITTAYADLISNMFRNNNSQESFKYVRLKELILRQASHFTLCQHQDTKEFIIYFLKTMHKELEDTIIERLFSTELISTVTCTACKSKQSTKQSIDLLSIPLNRQERKFVINFIGKNGLDRLISVHVPMNGRVENVVDEFSHCYGRPSIFYRILATLPDGEINLEIPLHDIPTDELIFMEQENKLRTTRPERLKVPDDKLTLEDCLKNFLSIKELNDESICPNENCKQKVPRNQQHQLSKLPSVLIIALPRFVSENGLRQKNETFVHFPITGLDFNKIIPSLEEETIYDLVAVIGHFGSTYDGHYTAYVRDSTKTEKPWFHLIGSSAKYIEPDDYEYDIVTRFAYILFYIKRSVATEV